MTISLTGFMGCGKSSVGRRLSELLCCPFMDLDEEIEKRARKSIPEIFAEDGEDAFRDLEVSTLSLLLGGEQRCRGWHGPRPSHVLPPEADNGKTVMSLGGGTVMRKECAEMVRENTLCIYLRASVNTLVENLKDEAEGRPMLASAGSLHDRIAELLALRSSTYENTAHMVIDTDGKSIDEIANEISLSIR